MFANLTLGLTVKKEAPTKCYKSVADSEILGDFKNIF